MTDDALTRLLADTHHGVLVSASGPHVEIRALAENPLRRGASMAIEATDEEDVFVSRRMGHRRFGVILTTSPVIFL